MDLETATNELYALSPDDFIERRQQLVAEARQARDRELATKIGKLRRPTRSAWLINLLVRQQPDEINALLELGTAIQEAQQRMAGDELRRLATERRKSVDGLARRAVELGREHGYSAPDGAAQEVSQTLQTALADQEIADLVRAGRLTQAVTYGGFGPTDLASAFGQLATKVPSAPQKQTAAEPASVLDPQQRRKAEKAAAEVREQAAAARKAADSAESEAEAATQHADELADRVESLRSELRQTEAAEREAREAARAARKHYQELRQAAITAEQAAAAAAEALDAG